MPPWLWLRLSLKFRRVVSNGGWSNTGIVIADESRAEVVDREDAVKRRFVGTVDFGPVFRVPFNHAKVSEVLPQRDFDGSITLPDNLEPVFRIVFVLHQRDVVAENVANNSLPLSTFLQSFTFKVIASRRIRPFLNSSVRVNHFVFLADLDQASLKHFKGGFFEPVVIIMSYMLFLHQLDDFLLQRVVKLLISSVQLFFRQFLVPAFAKAINRVDAGVIYRPGKRMLGNLM